MVYERKECDKQQRKERTSQFLYQVLDGTAGTH